MRNLRHPGWEVDGTNVHRFGHGLINQVDNKLASVTYVDAGVFERLTITAMLNTQHHDWRVFTHRVEVAIRRSVVALSVRPRCDQRNRARDDRRGNQLVLRCDR